MQERLKRVWSAADIRLAEASTTLTAQLHGLSCPACGCRKYIKSGKEKGNQRYRCSSCKKHFRSTTGNTIHHLHLKPKIQQYIDCMNQGFSLRKTAEECEISLRTAFRWRHRFLEAMRKQPEPQQYENRVVSEFTLPFSNKGKLEPPTERTKITSILQIDITGQTVIHVLGKYGLPACDVASKTQGRISHISSKQLPKLFKAQPATCVEDEQINQTLLVQEQIYAWLAKFRGVATKYLENYWNWFILIRQVQIQSSLQSIYMQKCF